MKLKLYHSTSSIFMNSIIEYGLGGINPNIKYRNLDLLRFLFKVSEKELINDPNYLKQRPDISAIAVQDIVKSTNGDLMNFKHDNIYVSLTQQRAICHAAFTKYGSEILQNCIDLFLLLKNKKHDFRLPQELNLFNIESYINKEIKHILIEIEDVDVQDLETEFGENAKDDLNKAQKNWLMMNEKDRSEKMQMYNFRLLKPIPSSKMIFFELKFEGSIFSKDFKVEKTAIVNPKYLY